MVMKATDSIANEERLRKEREKKKHTTKERKLKLANN